MTPNMNGRAAKKKLNEDIAVPPMMGARKQRG
jgi:hypothetical protein